MGTLTQKRGTIGAVLPEISHGDHCCLLFGSPDEQVAVTAPFISLGLERGERSVFVATADDVERLRAGLQDAGLEVVREVERGRLDFVSGREYLEGGKWSTEKTLAFLQRAYEETLGGGFNGLRAAGDVLWQVGPEQDFRGVVSYETLLTPRPPFRRRPSADPATLLDQLRLAGIQRHGGEEGVGARATSRRAPPPGWRHRPRRGTGSPP